MDKLSGISAATANRLLLDAGKVYVDYGLGTEAVIGVTKGGNEFALNDEYREMPFDGMPGPVEGFNRLIKVAPVLKVNLLEHTTTNLQRIISGVSNSATGTHDVLTRDTQISTTHHITNVALVLQKTGTSELWVFKVSNALNKAPFVFGAADNDEGIIAVEFHAHFLPSDLETEPWEISNPLEGASGYYTITYTAGANGSIVGDASQVIQSSGDGTAVVAVADSGYNFSAWSDAYSAPAGMSEGYRIDETVVADAAVTATFVAE